MLKYIFKFQEKEEIIVTLKEENERLLEKTRCNDEAHKT